MRAAAADQRSQRLLDLVLAGIGRLPQEGSGGHDPAIDAIAALIDLLLDPGGLDRVRLLRGAKAGKRGDLRLADGRHRHQAGAYGDAVDMHRAGAALAEPAAEAWIVHAELA
jgi:hypothetical protein